MRWIHTATLSVTLFVLALFLFPPSAPAQTPAEKTVSFGIIGMAGGAVQALSAYENELNVTVTSLKPERFRREPLPDLAAYDVIITSFATPDLKEQYKQSLKAARTKNSDLKVFCVGPAPICEAWTDWVGKENIHTDPKMAAYYGLSKESMRDMLRYTLITHLGRSGVVSPPGSGPSIKMYHPKYPQLAHIPDFLERAAKDGWDTRQAPRVALGSWRHHVLFHQPKVIDALMRELEKRGMLALCLVADDAGFTKRLTEFKPDLVIMTSHTRETPDFWKKLGVPRLHALWFTHESIDQWRKSNQTGMVKSSQFHQIASSELKGATECLTAGGTESGGDGGEEILPIPDRIRRIVGRAQAWIALSRIPAAEKKLALVTYDREADKAGLMSGPAHNLNAPRSMLALLDALQKTGYTLKDIPANEEDLIARLVDHGRQMGSWEPGSLDKLARSGHAILVPEKQYRTWFEEQVPEWRRKEVVKQWGAVPGEFMVWTHKGKRFLVLPKLDLGNAVLLTQPPKGETISASLKVEDPDESLLPPTHHYLATYFWLQNAFKPDALVHFGSHGSEWLFPGKQAVLSRADWSDILIGDLPNINPWLSSNTSEILPCKRRARAVTVDFLPPPLMEAGLSDELLNLESSINKYQALDAGALKKKFAESVTRQVEACKLDRDLDLQLAPGALLGEAEIERIAKHLHDLGNELIPASMHVLGQPPADDLRIPYLVYSMGKRFLKTAAPLFVTPENPTPDDAFLKQKGKEILTLMLKQGLSASDAVKACGGHLPQGALPQKVAESLQIAVEMNAGLLSSRREIDGILEALEGKFIEPGPSGNPERNPSVVPTGRNMYVMNPEELPSRASWELGTKLIRDYLQNELDTKGRYPGKIAFSLVPFAAYSDFGIIESQILYLIGVRPAWDAKNRVRDVELIPAAELGRPRIDVFLSARSIYRDELPSLMKLLDKAIRLVASLNEKDNRVYQNSQATRKALEAKGFSSPKAQTLSKARMYGAEPDEILDAHNWFFYLTERSGEWENREDLLDVYLQNSKHVYTQGAWGDMAPEAFDSTIQGTDLILKSWYDNRDFVLSNKFAWWVDGTLSLAIKHLTGKEPDYLFVDVRDTDEAQIVDSGAVVQKDFRARLTNPKWIAGMQKEGYAGGNIIAKNIDNLMGWEIMREDSIADSNWNDLTDVYLRDRHQLGLRHWFDTTNPHAFQKLSVTLLETIRKDFWKADDATRLEITAAYAESVVKHGRSSGVREGGNDKLETFIDETLSAPKTPEMDALLKQYREKSAELTTPSDPAEPGHEPIAGKRLDKKADDPKPNADRQNDYTLVGVIGLACLIILAGFLARSRRSRKQGHIHHD